MPAQLQALRLAAGGILEPTNPAWPLQATVLIASAGSLPGSPYTGQLAVVSDTLYWFDGTTWQNLSSGSSGAATWGTITGTLASQSDLAAALAACVPYAAAQADIDLNGNGLFLTSYLSIGGDGVYCGQDYALNVSVQGLVGGTSLDSGAITTDGSGHLTAASFTGSGAGLTGISHTQVSGLGSAATQASSAFDAAGTATAAVSFVEAWVLAQGYSTSGGSMTYPGAGVPNSTGSAWGTSYAVGTGNNDLVQLTAAGKLPAVDGSLLTGLAYTQVSGLATVAHSGAYADLSGAPSIPSITGLVPYSGATGDVSLGTHKLITDGIYLSPDGTTPSAVGVINIASGNISAVIQGAMVFGSSTSVQIGDNGSYPSAICVTNGKCWLGYGADNGSGLQLQVTGGLSTDTMIASKAYHGTLQTPSIVSNAVTVDFSTGNVQKLTLPNGTTTAITIANVSSTQRCLLFLYQDSTGGALATWSGVDVWQGAAGAPTLTATASRIDIIGFVSDGTNVAGMCSPNFG